MSLLGNHLIVGIGACTGGKSSLLNFLKNVPNAEQHTYIIVQPYGRSYHDLKKRIEEVQSDLEVIMVREEQRLNLACVYVVPAKTYMVVEGGNIKQIDAPSLVDACFPIDILFRSLALDAKERAVGILLPGISSDGTEGLIAIKNAGGVAIAESPGEASFDGMLKSAISTGVLDYVANAKDLGEKIELINSNQM